MYVIVNMTSSVIMYDVISAKHPQAFKIVEKNQHIFTLK